MTLNSGFNEILSASVKGWRDRNVDESVLSIALPLKEVDPFLLLPVLAEKQFCRFLWDSSPGICIAAAGQCQSLEMSGPYRFDLAQQFSDKTFSQLIDITPHFPVSAFPRIFLAFSFFENIKNSASHISGSASFQAVLPRWQLSCQKGRAWLRLNAVINNESDIRENAEHLWLKRQNLCQFILHDLHDSKQKISIGSSTDSWKKSFTASLEKGIDLVNSGELQKLVLAVKQSIVLEDPLDPLNLLVRLRDQQSGSCRFLWQWTKNESFFGASPERLISCYQGTIRSDALAGTAAKGDDGQELLRSTKNLREHELVVSSILSKLKKHSLSPSYFIKPRLVKQGSLIHLHTPIVAPAKGKLPLSLVESLHPTPAVAGLPGRSAMNWIRALEPFERGNYAAPIGWVDSKGNADFRVAIRSGYTRDKNLYLMAGAGLIKGSSLEGEMQEVGLKFDVLLTQLNLKEKSQIKSFSRRSNT